MASRAKRLISDKLIDLYVEQEMVKYRRGIVKANIEKYKKLGDTKNASIHQNRYNELVELEKDIRKEIFDEVRKTYREY